ncbi:hypothetical protein GCM10010503_04960 [Streptomyces lucensis JCM 4490]|uniref:Peptidase M50 n=1 Tax=Streptomyces lucensis JCM 4490 TaxID=1306176 RepID=A0A918MK09_9ACTN|nr:hypothetical protein [Streptomyces lucensis]GGW32208.1 hypothetical protein GCM10010503_04960 [Streptomyces lucensis JCM 4490]
MPAVTAERDPTVVLHPLEVRRDRDEWIVGRQGNEQVVALPDTGLAALRLLGEGRTVRETRAALRRDTGRDLDVGAFAESLAAAGLVAAIGERRFESEPVPVSFPRLRQRHVRWSLHPLLHALVLAVPLAGLTAVGLRRHALPSWDDLVWAHYGTVNLLVQSLVAWCLIGLHELAHLVTARAAGVAGRVRLGTRLQFLVAQTEVSGIWLKDRRARLTVYLSGLAVDGAVWGGCLLALAAGVRSPLLPVAALTLVTSFANQCLVFMRTDLYFVAQDLTGCRNLYSDAGAYLRHLAARLLRRPSRDPLAGLRPGERRMLKAYAVGAVAGTAVCVLVGVRLLLSVTWPLLVRSAHRLVTAADPVLRLDALVTVLVLAGLQLLWARLWWRRHGTRVRRAARTVRRWAGPRTA